MDRLLPRQEWEDDLQTDSVGRPLSTVENACIILRDGYSKICRSCGLALVFDRTGYNNDLFLCTYKGIEKVHSDILICFYDLKRIELFGVKRIFILHGLSSLLTFSLKDHLP